jgi:hypothetical protein
MDSSSLVRSAQDGVSEIPSLRREGKEERNDEEAEEEEEEEETNGGVQAQRVRTAGA